MMQSLSAFLPVDRRRALAAGRTLPDRVQGAALFADISGFTPLTAALAGELGAKRGAEELSSHLSQTFTALIAQVHLHGGSVIFFSGDAITCWFDEIPLDGDPESIALSPAPERALACGLALQYETARMPAIVTPGGTVIRIGLKVAVVAGEARRFLVGDPEQYCLEVLAGSTLDLMARAEQLAERGEVIAPVRLLARLPQPPELLEYRDLDDEHFALVGHLPEPARLPLLREPPELPADMVRPWILPPVFARLMQGPGEFLAELRPITALFLKFHGIDYDADHAAGEKLDRFVRAVQLIVSRFQGFILQITIGDKGSYLLISFGAPLAHEDDSARAAAAALALRELPAQFDFLSDCRIGISSGLVHSGAYGSLIRRTYGIQGTEVNISARLMSAAGPGQIIVSDRAAKALAEEYELDPLPPLELKGVHKHFVAWALTGRRAVRPEPVVSTPDAPLVGREAEQAVSAEALTAVVRGASRVLLIEGDAGIGKSSLAADLLRMAAAGDEEMVVAVGTADALEGSTPYFAWRAVFESIFTFGEAATGGPEAVLQWREELLTGWEPEQLALAPLLGAVLPLDLPDSPLTEQMSGEARRESTQQLLVTLLREKLAGRPLLLLLEDAHWLDSNSWVLAGRVQREVQPLLMVLATRPLEPDVPAVYDELRRLPGTRRLLLDRLPPAAIEELVCRRLGARALPEPVARLIHEKAEGHPFFSEQLAYALRDAGIITVVDGECRLSDRGSGPELPAMPDTIQGVITSRIDLLPPTQQLTVKVASVIGRIFAYRVLRDIYPDPREATRLRENLDALDRLDITPQETPEPNLTFLFKHYVTQEVVYNLMTFQQRRLLHRNVAGLFEQERGDDPARLDPMLGHHWSLAGEDARAVFYYASAGERAFRDYANAEALSFLTRALELGGEEVAPSVRANRHRLAAEAAYRLTLMEQSQLHYLQALAILGHAVPGGSLGLGLGLLGRLVRQVWHRLRRMPARDAPAERGKTPLLEAAAAYEGVSEIYYNAGDFLSAFYCVMAALNLAEQAGPSPELTRGYANMCATLGTVSLNGPAEGYRRRAVRLAAAIDDLPTRAWIRIPLSIHSLWVGEWDRSEAEIGEALAIYSRLGDWRRWSVAAWLWPQVAEARGEPERAADLWAQLYEVALRSRDTRHQVRCRGGQFFNHITAGRRAEALVCLANAGEILAANPEMEPVEKRLWHAANALAALETGDFGRARDEAHAALAAIEQARFKFDLLAVFASPAEVFLALWEQGRATREEAQLGVRALGQYARAYRFARPRSLRCAGRLELQGGKPDKAARLWSRSIAQAEALQMPSELALTRQVQARLSATRDARG